MTDASENAVYEVPVHIEGDGTALIVNDTYPTFGLTECELDGEGFGEPRHDTVVFVPHPENTQHTIFWVRGAPPNTDARIRLTYPPL